MASSYVASFLYNFLKGKAKTIRTKRKIIEVEEKKIATKAKMSPAVIKQMCDDSLKRLNTDYIDLYQYHLDDAEDGQMVRDVLEELVAEGKIRYYGWSTNLPKRAKIFAEGK